MNNDLIKQVILNEDKLIIEAYYGNEKAFSLLMDAYDSGYKSKYLDEGWQEFRPRSNVLHPVKAVKNMWDNIIAKHHKRKINKLNRRLSKDIDDYKEAQKLGADADTLKNIKNRYFKAGGDELDDRLGKYRNRRLNILNRNSGNDAKDNYDVYDKNGDIIKPSALVNDRRLNYGHKTIKDFDNIAWLNNKRLANHKYNPYNKNRETDDDYENYPEIDDDMRNSGIETEPIRKNNPKPPVNDNGGNGVQSQQEKDKRDSEEKRNKSISDTGTPAPTQTTGTHEKGSVVDNSDTSDVDTNQNGETTESSSKTNVNPDTPQDTPFSMDNFGNGEHKQGAEGEAIVVNQKKGNQTPNANKQKTQGRRKKATEDEQEVNMESVLYRLSNIKHIIRESKYVK